MNSDSVVDKLLPVFLAADLEHFRTLVEATKSAVSDNHKEIFEFLKDIGVEDKKLIQVEKYLFAEKEG
jgi:ribosomal 50S subunit-associated protein YjgA (DUF615 family)